MKTKKLTAFLFISPNIILYITFFTIPFILGFWYSLTNYDGLYNIEFIGFKNYVELFKDPKFYKIFLQTTIYALISIPLVLGVSLSIALSINSKILKGKNIHRMIIYFPALLSTVLVGITWRWIFGEEYGIINMLLKNFGFEAVKWSTNGTIAFGTIFVAATWGIGGSVLLYLGGLSTISNTYYEAAEIDGASKFQQIRFITIPLLKPTTYMLLTFAMVNAFKEFAMVKTLTNGGPGEDTTFMVQYIYKTGFELYKVGYASAASMVLFIILLILSIVREIMNRGGRVYD